MTEALSFHPAGARALAAARRVGPAPGEPGFDLQAARALEDSASSVAGPLGTPGSAARIAGVPCWIETPPAPTGGVALFIHGGGWVLGTAAAERARCAALAFETAWTIVAVEYSRAPESAFPTALDEITAVAGQLLSGPTAFSRLAVVGESAGGNLAAAYSYRAAKGGIPRPDVQVLISPVLDVTRLSSARTIEGIRMTPETLEWCVRAYVPDDADRARPEVSPLQAKSFEGLPPTALVVGEHDFLCADALEYAQKLNTAGIDTLPVVLPGMPHDFGRQTDSWPACAVGDLTASALRRWAPHSGHALDALNPKERA